MCKILAVLFCILVCTSCNRSMVSQSQDVRMVDTLRRQNNFNLASLGLVRVGVGDAYNPEYGTLRETYQTRKLHFQTADEARSFFVKVFNEYIAHFNSDPRLSQYVKGYPFSSQNTELQITVLDETGDTVASPEIARIRNDQNTLVIYSYDKNTKTYQVISKEPLY